MDDTFEIFLETLNISLKLFMASLDSAMNRRLRIAFSFLRQESLPICIAFATVHQIWLPPTLNLSTVSWL